MHIPSHIFLIRSNKDLGGRTRWRFRGITKHRCPSRSMIPVLFCQHKKHFIGWCSKICARKVRRGLHYTAQPAYIQNRNHGWNVLFVHPWSQEHWSSHSSHFPSLFQILLESIPQFYHLVRILSSSESMTRKFIFEILWFVRKNTSFKVNFTQWHILVLCQFCIYNYCLLLAKQCYNVTTTTF